MESKLGYRQQLIKGDGAMLASALSDESNLVVKKLLSEHNPDGLDYDVKALLHLVEDILRRVSLSSEGVSSDTIAQVDHVEDRSHQPGYINVLEALSFKIDRISSEMSHKILSGVDANTTTLAIFEMVTNFKWDVKLVLALAAFALPYGEYWLLAQLNETNQLAKSVATLKQVPPTAIMEPKFQAINDLVKVILEVTRCVIEFNDLPTQYITQEVSSYTTAASYIPVASFWCVRGIVACETQIASLTAHGHDYLPSSTEANWELSTMAHKLKNILDHLKKQLDNCYKHIEKKIDAEAYDMLVDLFSTPHLDNMKVLKALIYAKDDILPLYEGSSKRRVSLEPLRRKNVLLLISGLDFYSNELMILEQIYNDSRAHASRPENRYELVWFPIVDIQRSEWTDKLQRQFDSLQEAMPWYSVYHPSLISKPVIWFIQREWKYKKKPILVVLDPLGRVASPNAIHMVWIWGISAFPFTSKRERELWDEESWRLELLVDGIDQEILNWIKDGKYIFVYGGGDPDWVRSFVKEARRVAQASQIPLEMVYVGKSNKKEQVQKVLDTISREKLNTHYWEEQSMTWFFWTRIESMFFSKIQLNLADEHDLVMQEIKKLLSYDKEGGWVILAKGSYIAINGHHVTGLQTLLEYDTIWKQQAEKEGFEKAYKDHYGKLHATANPCCRFDFSHEMGRIPDKLRCPECHRLMHVLTTFQCCHDDNTQEPFVVSTTPPTS